MTAKLCTLLSPQNLIRRSYDSYFSSFRANVLKSTSINISHPFIYVFGKDACSKCDNVQSPVLMDSKWRGSEPEGSAGG